jgi:hypothetical protein
MNMMGIIIWKLIHCQQATVAIHTENDSEASSAYRAGPGTMVYPLEMRWTGDTINISQSVVVVETQLQVHLFPFRLKVMYNLKQQRKC